MKSAVLYRIASALLFRQTDPHWGVDSVVASMRTIRYDVQGFSRTHRLRFQFLAEPRLQIVGSEPG